MKLKLPEQTTITYDMIVHPALARPKPFIVIEINDLWSGKKYSRFVLAIPALLRIRLAIASRRLARTVVKHRKFLERLEY